MNIRLLSIILMLTFSSQAGAQGYFKIFPPVNYESFLQGIVVDDSRYAFITTNTFHVLDGNGNEVVTKPLMAGMSSFLEAITRDKDGHFWIASNVFVTLTSYQRILYKVNLQGDILSTKIIDLSSASVSMKLMASGNNLLLLHREINGMGRYYIQGDCFDLSLNLKWTKPVSLELYSKYALRLDESGGSVSIAYQSHDLKRVWVSGIDFLGTLFHQEIAFKSDPLRQEYTDNFARTPDGGFIMTGSTLPPDGRLEDALIYKSDAGGFVEWTKRLDIHLGDRMRDIIVVPDGYYVFGESGFRDWISSNHGDWVLLKLDLNGNEVWRKAYGGPAADYAVTLDMHNGNLYMGGRSSHPGRTTAVPTVCRTDLSGNFQSPMPVSLEPASSIMDIPVNTGSAFNQYVAAAAAGNGDVIYAGNYKGADDATYAFAQRVDATGNVVWYERLSGVPGTLRFAKPVNGNQFLVAIERKDMFVNLYELILLDHDANVIWREENGSSTIKDVITTSDGGYLLVGAEDITFIDYEVVLIKLDATGHELWRKRIGEQSQWETGRQVIETPEHDYLVVGNDQAEYTFTSQLHILKVDRNGNTLWKKNITGGTSNTIGYAVNITSDGNYLFAATENPVPFGNKNLLIVKTNNNGQVHWEKRFDLFSNDEAFHLQAERGGGFLVAGTTGDPGAGKAERFSYVMKLSSSGAREWTRYYGTPGLTTLPGGFQVFGTDTLLLGTRQIVYGKENPFRIRLNGIIGTDPIEDENTIYLWPNPATNESAILIRNEFEGEVVTTVFDAAGRKVKNYRAKKLPGNFQQYIDVSSLARGVYFVVVRMGGTIVTKRLTVGR